MLGGDWAFFTLVVLQRDMGTAMVVAAAVAMYYVAGASSPSTY